MQGTRGQVDHANMKDGRGLEWRFGHTKGNAEVERTFGWDITSNQSTENNDEKTSELGSEREGKRSVEAGRGTKGTTRTKWITKTVSAAQRVLKGATIALRRDMLMENGVWVDLEDGREESQVQLLVSAESGRAEATTLFELWTLFIAQSVQMPPFMLQFPRRSPTVFPQYLLHIITRLPRHHANFEADLGHLCNR